MNARELHDRLEYEHGAGLRWLFSSDSKERETILRALRLLAAAEANDGTSPETDILIEAVGLDPTCPNAEYFRRLERERNGLAAKVALLEDDITMWRAEATRRGNEALATASDEITKRERAEAALAESERKCERLAARVVELENECSAADIYGRTSASHGFINAPKWHELADETKSLYRESAARSKP